MIPGPTDRTRLDLATVDDDACRALLDRCARAGIAVAVWEVTADAHVPVFACQIQEDHDDGPLRRVAAAWGYGCHPTRAVALARALTEAAQSRLTWIAGSRDDCLRREYDHYLAATEVERERSYLDVRGPMRRFGEAPTFEADTFDEDIAWLLARLASTGVAQAAVVDLTLPGFEIPVVRVVVPGLEVGEERRRRGRSPPRETPTRQPHPTRAPTPRSLP